ncbi:MAG: ABC-F family ATP-binding cassette domain-containing protein [Alphaproteobacteria bacterium]|nr:ABC-F family ATP-binding cassette domain-containing protein [Alphaproteobacteria bacterium]
MLQITNISFSIQGKPLFEDASAVIPTGHKVGIVGRNGTGKTTLFKLIKKSLSLDSGTIETPSYFKIGGVEQEAPASNTSLLQTVLEADTERTHLLQEADTCEDAERITEIYQRLADIEAYSAEARAASILAGLGFDNHAQQRPCHEFSGGWRMRVALGAVLFSKPDLLLLDEPTNYLDLEGAYWLEQFLAKFQNTALIISHDRELLNKSVNGILHLSNLKLTYFTGSYDQFDAERRAKLEHQTSMKRKQDAQRLHIQSFVDRFRAKASKAKQAQSRIKLLEKMKPIVALTENAVAGFSFPTPAELRPPLVVIDKGEVGYNDKAVLSRLSLRIDADDRIALLGANGEGKSTLSKLIANRLSLMAGEYFATDKLRIGFFAQHQLDELTEGDSAYTHILRLQPDMQENPLRNRLGSAGFNKEIIDLPVEQLSGGQKARLLLLIATINAPHILILDEPTNHLDIESREALILALNDYKGAVIIVSHDTYLVETVADKFWLVNNGEVVDFDGDMREYKHYIMTSQRRQKRNDNTEKKSSINTSTKAHHTEQSKTNADNKNKKVSIFELRKKHKEIDKKIEVLNAEKTKIETELSAPDYYSNTSEEQIKSTAKRLSTITKELEKMELMWLEISEKIEGVPS